MSLEGTNIRMIIFAIQAFEAVRARFTLFGFKFGWTSLKVCFIAPSKVFVVFNFVEAIVFDTSQTLSIACKCGVFPFSVVFVLGNSWVYVHFTDNSDVIANIEASVD